MRARILVPILLFAAAGALGWLMIWNDHRGEPAAGSEDPEPEPELQAPKIVLAPPAPPKPPPPEVVPPAPVAAPPSPPEPVPAPAPQPTYEPSDPRRVLRLPEQLQTAPEEEQRKYYEQLLAHHEGMIGYARKNLETLEQAEDGNSQRRAAQMRKDLDLAEQQMDLLRERLAENY